MLSPSLLTPQVWQDALDIVTYIAADNPDAAVRFVPALEVLHAFSCCDLYRFEPSVEVTFVR